MRRSFVGVALPMPAECASIQEKSLFERNPVTLPGLYFNLLVKNK